MLHCQAPWSQLTQTRAFIIAVCAYYVKDLATSFQRNKAISMHKVNLLLNDLEYC